MIFNLWLLILKLIFFIGMLYYFVEKNSRQIVWPLKIGGPRLQPTQRLGPGLCVKTALAQELIKDRSRYVEQVYLKNSNDRSSEDHIFYLFLVTKLKNLDKLNLLCFFCVQCNYNGSKILVSFIIWATLEFSTKMKKVWRPNQKIISLNISSVNFSTNNYYPGVNPIKLDFFGFQICC